ncbi:hypothetical protein ABZ807_19465 [Micromonospora sp. NPDC047548]|uniref:hypothetical protein n=1 Tax=Micromonospora sp. NPDC047548 TaxID=3155624 RepID=UPI0033CE56E4
MRQHDISTGPTEHVYAEADLVLARLTALVMGAGRRQWWIRPFVRGQAWAETNLPQAHDRAHADRERADQVFADAARLVNPGGAIAVAGIYPEKDLTPRADGTTDGQLRFQPLPRDFFRLATPRTLGGQAASVRTAIKVWAELARSCASSSWLGGITYGGNLFASSDGSPCAQNGTGEDP